MRYFPRCSEKQTWTPSPKMLKPPSSYLPPRRSVALPIASRIEHILATELGAASHQRHL